MPRKKKQPTPGESHPPRDGGYARNPGIDNQRETVTFWRREAMRTRPAADAVITLGGTACYDYLATLGDAMYVAYHGVSRPLSGTGSQMGVGHPGALALIRAEQRALTQRARTLRAKLDTLIGESAEIPDEIVVDGKGIRETVTLDTLDAADDAGDVADAA